MDIHNYEDLDNVWCTTSFWNEFDDIFKKSSRDRKKTLDWLDIQFNIVSNLGALAGNIEKLPGTDNIYSLRKVSRIHNMRALCVFGVSGNNVYFLTSFLEKSKSDYSRGISRATARKKELKENGYL